MGASLNEVLADAQRRGFLGRGDLDAYIGHARGYLDALGMIGRSADSSTAGNAGPADAAYVDLGSGGGIPGLVLALEMPDAQWHLVERGRARADWLTRSVMRLGLRDRVGVRHEPAELTGRGALRGRCAAVVARSFARPSVAAECAAPLLQLSGRAIFSDLGGSTRWDEGRLGELGLFWLRQWHTDHGSYVLLEQRGPCPDRFPRSPGVPARRPLF